MLVRNDPDYIRPGDGVYLRDLSGGYVEFVHVEPAPNMNISGKWYYQAPYTDGTVYPIETYTTLPMSEYLRLKEIEQKFERMKEIINEE